MPQLLNNASATGSAAQWGGGRGVFAVAATFGGGSVALEYLGPDETTWLTVGTALTANGLAAFELPPGRIRAAVVTATAVFASAEASKG
jgi:hypothetical protein